MAKIYSEQSKKEMNFNPKDETIRSILNYSKSLRVIKYKGMSFESIQN